MIVMTSLIDMYSKCIGIKESRRVFDEMTEKDVIAMNTMVSGLCRCGLTMEAMGLFQNMSNRDIGFWNSLISVLARNSEGAAVLVNGKQFHGMVIKHGFGMYRPIGNAILDMYVKCGCMDEASLCFGNIVSKNVISWTSLIIGFCKNGLGDEALKAFGQMEMEEVVPNKIIFLGVLYACSHARLVQEGLKHFNIMINSYCFATMMEHYTCMVDLFARSGYLEQALEFIEKKMPVKPDAKLLITFLSSCYFHKNVELAKSVGKRLLELEPR
ncbi:hypothetical protein GIB67_022965 [Kingdonia uniflora]|uniref:Pentatricopeptide repeat-containing protein n=1 Tax=Kingdonia uniflora TaxID=39325 RepID=A0A7J7P2D0_9MAGN|nr:hypothetical protein GIB67_022965 [Kingdonia uniflora]